MRTGGPLRASAQRLAIVACLMAPIATGAACTAANPDFVRADAPDAANDTSNAIDGGVTLPPGATDAIPPVNAGTGGGIDDGAGGTSGGSGAMPSDAHDDSTTNTGGVVSSADGGASGTGGIWGATNGGTSGTGGMPNGTGDQGGSTNPSATGGQGAPDTAPPIDTAPPPVDSAPPPVDTRPPVDTTATNDGAPSQTNGLQADYFNGKTFEQYVFTRIDQTIDFNWKDAAPDPRVPADLFSARWTGWVEPRYSETYTFITTSDDGARLWIDGVALIDSWVDQSQVEHTATVTLVAGRRYAIKMEYYDHAKTAAVHLFWSSPSQAREVVPYTRLWTP